MLAIFVRHFEALSNEETPNMNKEAKEKSLQTSGYLGNQAKYKHVLKKVTFIFVDKV